MQRIIVRSLNLGSAAQVAVDRAAAEAAAVAAADSETAAAASESSAATSADSAAESSSDAQDAKADAEAARDDAVDISNISTSDAVVEALVKNTGGGGPLTSAALATLIRKPLPLKTLNKVKAGTAIRFGVLGDSVLQGSTATTPGTDDAASLFRSTLASRFGVTVTKDNQAQGGRTAWWEMVEKFETVVTGNADVYILGITGKNDINYEATASGLSKHLGFKTSASLALIESKVRELRIRKPDADVILMSGNPYSSVYTTANGYQKTYSQGLALIAAYYGLPYVDGWNAVKASGGDYAANGDLSDGVHPNSAGHLKLANAMLDLFPASWDPSTVAAAPRQPLPDRIYASKHAIALKEITTTSVTAYTDRVLTPSFVGGSWSPSSGSGPWTSSTANDTLHAMMRCTDAAIRFTYGAGQGVVDIIVDGQTYASGLALSSVTDADQWLTIPDLTPGLHNVIVKVVSGSVTVERFGCVPAAAEFIDVRDTRVTITNNGATSDINTYFGIHSNASTSTRTDTVTFVGTGLSISVARGSSGGGAYWSGMTVDGVAGTTPSVPTAFGGSGTGTGYGSLTLVSGLDYGEHTVVLTYQATGVSVAGWSVLDERPELHPNECFGYAKVGETVRPPLPFAATPSISVTSTTANTASVSTASASSFLVTGTSGDVVRWKASAPKRVLF